MSLISGTRLGPYEIIAPLGAGGMGEVYRARDTRLGREVAIKVLPGELSSDPDLLRRFKQEARAASALNHPNVLTVHDVGTHEGTAFLVTELLVGDSLREILSKGPLPQERVLEIALQIGSGLTAAHQNGIIHRDLKPENLFVTREGVAKILDFGLAKIARSHPAGANLSSASTLVKSSVGIVVGTVGYMAPEQVRGEPADARSDIFAFGCVLYELVMGQRAFERGTAIETLSAILHDEPPPLPSSAGLSPAFVSVIECCLKKGPEDRFQSALDLASALHAMGVGSGASSGARRTGPMAALLRSRGTRTLVAVTVALVLVTAVTALVLVLEGKRERDRPVGRQRVTRAGQPPSIAVLPFRNISGDPRQEYFVDGMTEALISSLARAPDVLVIDRESVFDFKNRAVVAQQVGRELGADYLLEGSLRRDSDRLRVDVQLVEASTGRSIFTKRFDQEEGQIFAIQSEVVRRVSAAVGAATRPESLPTARAVAASGPPTRSLKAYDLFLRANFLLANDTKQTYQQARELLVQAVALDPDFAQAHARLGYVAAHEYFLYEPREEWERLAYVSIEKARALDPSLAEPYVARANLVWTLPKGFRFDPALNDLLHAIELEPNNSHAHHWLGILTFHLGLYERAIAEFSHSLRLDPTNSFDNGFLAWIETDLGHPEVALEIYERNPKLTFGRSGEALLRLGRVEEARRSVEADLATAPKNSGILAWHAVILARGGDAAAAEKDAGRAAAHLPNSGHIHHAEYDIARTYALLGRKRDALDWLERTARDGMPNYTLFATDPLLINLRGDPAFQEFLRRMKVRHDHFLALIEGHPETAP